MDIDLVTGSTGVEQAVLMLMERMNAVEDEARQIDELKARIAALEPQPLPPGVRVGDAARFNTLSEPVPMAIYLEASFTGWYTGPRTKAIGPAEHAVVGALNKVNDLAAAFAKAPRLPSGTLWLHMQHSPAAARYSVAPAIAVLYLAGIEQDAKRPPQPLEFALAFRGVLHALLQRVAKAKDKLEKWPQWPETLQQLQDGLQVDARKVVAIRSFVTCAKRMSAMTYTMSNKAPYAVHRDVRARQTEAACILGEYSEQCSCNVSAVDGVLAPFGAMAAALHSDDEVDDGDMIV